MSIFDEIGSIFLSFQMFKDEVVHGSEWELNGVNSRIEELKNETKKNVDSTKNVYMEAIKRLYEQREMIAKTTLSKFAEDISKLKNVDFKEVKFKIPEYEIDMKFAEIETVEHKTNISDFLINVPMVSTGVSVGAWISREFRLMDEIDDAKSKLGQMEEECAKIRRKCTQIKSTAQFLNSTYKTCGMLQDLCKEFNGLLSVIIREKGVDYKKYDPETRKQIRTIYNVNMALNYFVTESVVTEKGLIKETYKKYITGVTNDKEAAKKYLEEEDFYLERK